MSPVMPGKGTSGAEARAGVEGNRDDAASVGDAVGQAVAVDVLQRDDGPRLVLGGVDAAAEAVNAVVVADGAADLVGLALAAVDGVVRARVPDLGRGEAVAQVDLHGDRAGVRAVIRDGDAVGQAVAIDVDQVVIDEVGALGDVGADAERGHLLAGVAGRGAAPAAAAADAEAAKRVRARKGVIAAQPVGVGLRAAVLGIARHIDGARLGLEPAGHGRVLHGKPVRHDIGEAVAVQVLEVEEGVAVGGRIAEAAVHAKPGAGYGDARTPRNRGLIVLRDARDRGGARIWVGGGGGDVLRAALPGRTHLSGRNPQRVVRPLPVIHRARHTGRGIGVLGKGGDGNVSYDIGMELLGERGRIDVIVDVVDDRLLVGLLLACAAQALRIAKRQVVRGDGNGQRGIGALAVITEMRPAAVILRQDIGGRGAIECCPGRLVPPPWGNTL